MENDSKNKQNNMSTLMVAGGIISIVLVIILQLFLGKYLWNNVLVKLLPTTVRPVGDLFDVLGLIILFAILFGGLTSFTTTCYTKCCNIATN